MFNSCYSIRFVPLTVMDWIPAKGIFPAFDERVLETGSRRLQATIGYKAGRMMDE